MYYAIFFALFLGLACPHNSSKRSVTIHHSSTTMAADSTGGEGGHIPPETTPEG